MKRQSDKENEGNNRWNITNIRLKYNTEEDKVDESKC